ncbi:MAG: hypothetical protein ACYC4M_09475, partial [Thermoleophilia bacterium]
MVLLGMTGIWCFSGGQEHGAPGEDRNMVPLGMTKSTVSLVDRNALLLVVTKRMFRLPDDMNEAHLGITGTHCFWGLRKMWPCSWGGQ